MSACDISIRKGSKVTDKRPSWNHYRPVESDWPGAERAQLEMLESIRNVLEAIQSSQMLGCDVRSAIYEIRTNTERTGKALERIDRRLVKLEKSR